PQQHFCEPEIQQNWLSESGDRQAFLCERVLHLWRPCVQDRPVNETRILEQLYLLRQDSRTYRPERLAELFKSHGPERIDCYQDLDTPLPKDCLGNPQVQSC